MSKLRWGILSTAKIGMRSVIPAIQQSRNGIAVAIASRDGERARAAARDLGVPRAFGSYADLLESDEIDAVYIPLPNSMHREWTIRAAECGKHILCEKPFALNIAETDEMIAAARQHNVVLMEAFMYRFHPQYARVRAMLARGAIGDLQVIRAAFCFRLDDLNNIRLQKNLGGGSLMDVGCYCVNQARLITGAEPRAVQARAVFGAQSQVDEIFAGILHFPGDVIAHFDAGFRQAYREMLEIVGSQGRIELARPIKPGMTGGVGTITLTRADDTRETIQTEPANHYQLMCEHFAEVVQSRAPLLYPPELDRGNMRVIDTLYRAARSGRVEEVE
ncbi:MAG: Gfo/Idh/MocA family oxidoreductase [Chloroflexi bacterium]|nr:Gfo/Idh/MocA family oxidoreductase [Chloroflexota bacterium]